MRNGTTLLIWNGLVGRRRKTGALTEYGAILKGWQAQNQSLDSDVIRVHGLQRPLFLWCKVAYHFMRTSSG